MATTAISITSQLSNNHYLVPQWAAPDNVLAVSTLRGLLPHESVPSMTEPLTGFNLALHVHDTPANVSANRQQLQQDLHLTNAPAWLQQTHSTRVVNVPLTAAIVQADASVTTRIGHACVVMTADCLPVLFCNQQGTQVAAVHAGWRGLAAGILENTLAKFENPKDVLVWLGPAIGPKAFEVGQDVYDACQDAHSFQPIKTMDWQKSPDYSQKYLANIYQLAKTRLYAQGVRQIEGGDDCTLSDAQKFYSHRRNAQSGRQATLISLLDKSSCSY